ncbi:MAG: sulfatase [Planctomycetota bacterium]
MLHRLSLLSILAVLPLFADDPPNVLVIVADDLGYGELGAQGNKQIPTPNIDSIAASGVRFTNGYVTCPVCAPTRAGLNTGRYQQRFGLELNPGPGGKAAGDYGLPREEKMLAERLKEQGYTTGMFGKWHLGYAEGKRPPERGFDEFFGFLGGGHSYVSGGRKAGGIMRGIEEVDEEEYLTDAFAREASSFIEKHADEPFYVYLPFNAVHSPLQGKEELLAEFPRLRGDRKTFAAMLTALDQGVGRVLETLRAKGLDEKTLVIFIADNGGPTPSTTSKNDPLRGTKATVYEGGIRVPYFVSWKGHVPEGKTYDRPVISLDIVPTVMAAVGAPVLAGEKLDGVDLLPFLAGEEGGAPHEALYWRYGDQMAIRKGDWKLLKTRAGGVELYDLSKDIAEEHDLAAEQVEKAEELLSTWEAWDEQLVPPRWRKNQGDDK